VSADAVECDLHRICTGHDGPRLQPHASRAHRHDVLSQREVRDRDPVPLIEAVIYHSLRSSPPLLGRLEKHDQRPAPLVPQFYKNLSRGKKTGHMHIMSACMHHWPNDTLDISHGSSGVVGKSCCLQNWEPIHVGAKEDGLPRSVSEHADEAMTTDVGSYFECIEAAEVVGDGLGGLCFEIGEFRVGVEMLVECFVFFGVYGR
jgi:hypothetical protein